MPPGQPSTHVIAAITAPAPPAIVLYSWCPCGELDLPGTPALVFSEPCPAETLV